MATDVRGGLCAGADAPSEGLAGTQFAMTAATRFPNLAAGQKQRSSLAGQPRANRRRLSVRVEIGQLFLRACGDRFWTGDFSHQERH